MNDNFTCTEIVKEAINSDAKSIAEVDRIRKAVCTRLASKIYPSFIRILESASEEERRKLWFLVFKPTRTISGVAPLAIMTRPYACPHGTCTFCPGGINSVFGSVPQSYTGNEPASMRAKRNDYDPYLQVFNRLEQYALLNQSSDKVELIIMSGTFPALSFGYQEEFIKYAFKAMNDFSEMFFVNGMLDFEKFKEFFELPSPVNNDERSNRIKEKVRLLKGQCFLEDEQKRNENSKIRCVAMAIETKPDCSAEIHINNMLKLGCTRVELGVQCLRNDILAHVNRGHTVEDSIKATQLLKDSFLKVGYHMMPGLPGSANEEDINMFKTIFDDENFKPDFLKIYPCMVMPGTKLEQEYNEGRFNPIETPEAADIIASAKKFVPAYCRIMRIQRDIPSTLVKAGVKSTNLRQIVESKKPDCKCIRCREPKGRVINIDEGKIRRFDYKASGGDEVFISFETEKNLIGFCRLRIPFKPYRPEITARSAGIRELHVYSESVGIGNIPTSMQMQHRGIGKMLMGFAEKISAEEFDVKKMLVISGIGAKEYYKKLGYIRDGVYMSKFL